MGGEIHTVNLSFHPPNGKDMSAIDLSGFYIFVCEKCADIYMGIYLGIYFVNCRRYIHGDVLQRAVRQVCDAADVRLLPELGAGLGVSKKGYPRRDTALRCGHHQPAGGRDGPIL